MLNYKEKGENHKVPIKHTYSSSSPYCSTYFCSYEEEYQECQGCEWENNVWGGVLLLIKWKGEDEHFFDCSYRLRSEWAENK